MQWPEEAIAHLEDIVAKLTGEIHLAKPNSDEGILPILSLASELSTELPNDPAIRAIIESIDATLEPLLNEAKHFDPNSIKSLKNISHNLSEHLLHLKASAETEYLNAEAEPKRNASEFANPLSNNADPINGEQIVRFETLARQFSEELLLAETGSDEGMLPIYSLLNEFSAAFDGFEFMQLSLGPVVSRMDWLLENTAVFDESTISLLNTFNLWLESARPRIFQGGAPSPFEIIGPEIPPTPPGSKTPLSDDDPVDFIQQFSEFDVRLDLNLEENQELLGEFHSEALDHLSQIETAVLDLERDVSNPHAIDSMFRSFHTIKGVAGFLNLVPVNRLAHEIESLMDLVRTGKLPVFTGIIDLVLESKDTIGQQIEQISTALTSGLLPTEVIPVSRLMARARWAMEGPAAYAEQRGESLPCSRPNPSLENTAGTKTSSPPSLATDGSKGSIRPSKKSSGGASIRVNASKLDDLMDSVGELVIVQSQLQEASKTQFDDPNELRRNMTQLARISKELRRTSLSLRMIPIKSTFQKMSRIVRDISAKVGKKVAFEISGEETELDRNVVEEISDPLVHMIRNAIDHGLESPEKRIQSRKSETARISLKAYHQSSNIVIELSDDGCGIDPKRVLEKAISKGLIGAHESLPTEEIYKLILSPGFSTAEQVTDLSGRGVGMDVVRRNIETLRGKIEIYSELGKGSTFKIILPLTMAIVDGLVVKVGTERFILPTSSVKVALRPDEKSLAKIHRDQDILTIRGKFYPLFRLHNHFKIPNAITDPTQATVIIVETGQQQCGLLVDGMIGKQEVVVKSLGSMMQNIPGVSGGAILGDGNIVLILDTTTLINIGQRCVQ